MQPLRVMDLAPGYREFEPPAALSPLIACLWVRACGSDDEVRIMPDGASDVIWRQGHGTTIVREIDPVFDLDGDLPPSGVFTRLLHAAAGRRPDPVVLAAAPRVAEGDVAGLAFDVGYADQAHLTRETRRLAGLTPLGVIRARRAS